MNKTIYIGKTNEGSVTLTLNLEKHTGNFTTTDHRNIESFTGLSICGDILNGSSGQIRETLKEGLTEYVVPKENVDRILGIWEMYHLNDWNAGCVHQNHVDNNVDNWTELAAIETAKCPHGYVYGSSWLVQEIPEEILKEIKMLFEGVSTTPEQDMIQEIEGVSDSSRAYYIADYGLIINIEFKDTVRNDFGLVNKYTVYIKNEKSEEEISFEFTDSVNNTMSLSELHDELIDSILSCVKSDYYCNFSSFEEFCDELGFDYDSIENKETYESLIKHVENLNRVFEEDLITKLPD